MAILSKDEFFERVRSRIGDDTSDDAIKFLEDMTDTYSDFETRSQGGENWEARYKANDEAWRKRYQARFFAGNPGSPAPDGDPEPEPSDITIDDLFEEVK